MSMSSIPVITISRKFSAGGRSLAKALSERLSIPWYDKDFVAMTAGDSGYSEEEISAEGEEITGSQRVLDAILNNANSYTSSHDAIFKAQCEVMLSLSEKPCIIVGRCGNIVLPKAGVKTFSLFLHGDKDKRVKHTMETYGLGEADALKYLEKKDVNRGNYYRKYTGHEMDCADDYTLCLDTMRLGIDSCVDVICSLINNEK